jgi:S-(hydroxymethyl)glutathione dehydrogenase / alcohol dehydrogenase
MKAAVLREVGQPLQIEEVQIDRPGPHEVLIRTVAAGVCHSDLHFAEGAFPTALPTVLGHEAAGVVEAVGAEVRTVKPGDHVITCLNAYCGHCNYCVTGRLNLCVSDETERAADQPARLSRAGAALPQYLHLSAFAEQILTHEHAVVAIRKDMPLDRAALIGCAVITGFGAVTRTARLQAGETVAVIGCGGVGLSAINAAQIAGASRIIAIDTTASKERLAREFGATDFVNAATDNPVKAVRQLTGGGVDQAFECIGLAQTAEQAFAMAARGGAATVVGMIPVGQNVSIPGISLLHEKRLQGSFMGSNRFPVDMPRLVEFYMQGRLKLDQLISRRIRLDQVNEAFAEMKTGEIARSVVMFD